MKKILIVITLALAVIFIIGCQQTTEQVDKGTQANSITGGVVATTMTDTAKDSTKPSTDVQETKDSTDTQENEVETSETSNEEADKDSTSTDSEDSESTTSYTSSKRASDKNVKIIKVGVDGFSPVELDINVGETVRWVNTRSGRLTKALILGNRECIEVRSAILQPEQTYEYTFTSKMRCTIVEGITTRQIGTIVVD